MNLQNRAALYWQWKGWRHVRLQYRLAAFWPWGCCWWEQLVVCPSPQIGVLVRGAWLVCVNPKPYIFSVPKPRDWIFKRLASQKPDPFLLRATPISSANLPFFPVSWFPSLKPPHDLLFRFPNTEPSNPLQLLHHEISACFKVLAWASCAPTGCPWSLPLPLWPLNLSRSPVWGKKSTLPPLLVSRRCKKSWWEAATVKSEAYEL